LRNLHVILGLENRIVDDRVDGVGVTVTLAQEGRTQCLVADIPLGPASRRRRLH